MLNYFLALPFYVLFPVREAWHTGIVQHLLLTCYPRFETTYRPMSGLDNCFPSLHTSVSFTFAFVAMRHKYVKLTRVLMVLSVLVLLSTLYLGVHWPIDAAGGLVLAAFASGYGFDLIEKYTGRRMPRFATLRADER